METLIGPLLIDFQNMPASALQVEYNKQVYSAIKIHLSQMQKYDKTSHFNMCQKCGMILTRQDKDSVFDWEQICSNERQFKDIIQKYKEQNDNIVLWICTFCEMKNVIQCSRLKFAKNNSRVIERPAVQNNSKKDPILMIVFDISGSMEEVIPNETSSGIIEKIKNTEIYMNLLKAEQMEIKEIIEKNNLKIQANDPKTKFKDHLKKNKLLMGLSEYLIKQLNPIDGNNIKMERQGGFNKPSNKQKNVKPSKSIGFIFFNSNVIMEMSDGKQKKSTLIITDNKDSYYASDGHSKQKVNFDDFENLYKLGANYGSEYTSKLNDYKFKDLNLKYGDHNHGQTALGPALVIALGVISQHGAGSSIMLVTDGIGNKGIFDQSQKWQQQLKLLKMRLEKYKCFLTLLQCRNISDNPKQNTKQKQIANMKTCIDTFCARNDDTIAKKINILLDKNKTADNLIEDIKKKMSVTINREHVIWTNEVKIKCQNPNITFEDDMNKLSQKLHNQQQATYIHPKMNHNKLTEKDYAHHFMTQAVIKYENTQTGEQSIFLTYILQKIIKYDKIRKNTLKKLDNEKTFHDMMEYLSAEQQNYDISNIPLSFVKKTFRNTLMFSKSVVNRSMRFPIKGPNQNREEDISFFQEIYRKNAVKQEEQEEQDEENVTL